MCGWAIHTQAVQQAIRAQGIDCMVLDIGPGRRMHASDPDCVPVRGGLDFLIKILAFRFRGYTFEPHVNGDSWQGYLLALAAVLLGRFTGKPAILMFHAGARQMYFPRKKGFWYQAFRLLFHASGAIVCNMESVRREILQYGVPSGKIQAIFSVNYQKEAIPVPLPNSVEQFLSAHQTRLFSYTLFRPEYTPECLFEAFAQVRQMFPQAGLLIAGPQEVPPEIASMIRERGLESSVFISGNLAHAEFLTAIQRCDVFIRPVRDGLCASVIEALSLGVPVVALEDGTRPPSVITYPRPEVELLSKTIIDVLNNLDQARAQVQVPALEEDLDAEISLLVSVASGKDR
jgi:glycosyltransferase involved in cell wall biosynthesis